MTEPPRAPSIRLETDIRNEGDDLHVMMRSTLWANPPRRRRPPAVRVAPGQWVRWVINYRFSGYRGWSYSQVTMNLANGTIPVDAFLHTPPRMLDERARLF